MKKILSLAFILAFNFSFSQELKVKKGEILLDKVPVAKVEKIDKKYHFKNLQGETMFLADIKGETEKGNTIKTERWLELTSPDGRIREVALPENRAITFSAERNISEAVVKSDSKLVTFEGIDKEKVNAFFENAERTFSKKWDTIFEEEKLQIEREGNLAKNDHLEVIFGVIYKNGQPAGKVFLKEIKDERGFIKAISYQIGDVNNKEVAFAKVNLDTGESVAEDLIKISTFDKKEIQVLLRLTPKEHLAKRFVYRLYASGYPFGDMNPMFQAYLDQKNVEKMEAETLKLEKRKEQIALNKANSINIYDADGFVIDKDTKYEGKITLRFEAVSESLNPLNKHFTEITSYGSNVEVRQGEELKYFKAKAKVIGVIVEVSGMKFLGVKGNEDDFFEHGGSQLDVLSDGVAQFFQVLYEKDGNYVLAHIKYPQDYYLKLKKNEKAVYLGEKTTSGTKSQGKIKEIFDKYTQCNALDFSKYDTKSKESMIQIVDDYVKSCK